MSKVREMRGGKWGKGEKERERERQRERLLDLRVGTRKGLLLVGGYINPVMRSQPNCVTLCDLCDLGQGDLTSIFLSVK